MLRQLPRPASPSQEFDSPEAPPASASPSIADALTPVLNSSLSDDSQAVHIQLAQDSELEQLDRQEPTQPEAGHDASGDENAEVPDDSDDEDWSDSEDIEENDVVTGESAGSEADEADISINLIDVDLQQQVAGLISADKCERCCLEGNAKELEWLTCSLGEMTKTEKTTCILTLIGVLMQTDTASRRRGTGEREKFHFYLPFVGHVCRTAFAHCLGVQPLTVQRYKRRVPGKKRLVVYADNCSGQNKNNHVIKFLLAQGHMGVFERVDYKFFVKGHTKNSCDRGFGHIRKHVARQDCWILDDVVSAVSDSASTNTTVHISRGNTFFKSYKPLVAELYKTLVGVQQYHIFTAVEDQPGVVLCRKGPDDNPVLQDLRRKVDGILTEPEKVSRMFTHFLEDLSPPPHNAEKMLELRTKIRPYVPEEHQGNWIYTAPSEQQQVDAKTAKKARRDHRAAVAASAKANQGRRGREADNEAPPTPKKSRK